jgi:hypothetical protein
MRLKNTWILFVIAAAFLVYFFAVEQPRHEEDQEKIDQSTKISDLKREDIYHVALMRDDDTLTFTREAGTWRMTAPVNDNATDAMINTLISSAVYARIERTLQPGNNDESSFGLGLSPDAILHFETVTKDTSLTIRLGRHNITKSHFYAQVGTSNEVLLLPAGLRRYAMQEISDFRDRSMIDFSLDDIRKLHISSADHTLLWYKDSSNRWAATLDEDTIYGNTGQIEAILRRMRGIEAKEFVSDKPVDHSTYFTKEAGTISLWMGIENVEYTVHFSSKSVNTCHARVAGNNRIMLIDATILGAFDKSYDDLRDRKVFHFEPVDLGKIRLETSDLTATIIKTGPEWAFENPGLGGIDQSHVGVLLRRMDGLQFDDIIENRIRGSSAEKFLPTPFKFTLFDRDENVIDELSCVPHPDDNSLRLATSRSSRLLGLIANKNLLELEQSFRNILPE